MAGSSIPGNDADSHAAGAELDSLFRLIVEQSPVAVGVFDMSGLLLYANPQLLETSLALVGSNASVELRDLSTMGWHHELLAAAAAGAAEWTKVVRVGVAQDSSTVRQAPMYEMQVDARVVHVSGGEPMIVVYFIDRTELGLAQTQLEQSQQLISLGHLVAGIGHDFNNVLTAISGMAELMGLPGVDEDRRMSQAEAIVEASARAADLVLQMNTTNRQAMGEWTVQNVTSILESALTIATAATASGTILAVDSQLDADVEVFCNRTLAENAVLNLAINAIDAAGNNGAVHVSATEKHVGVSSPTVRPGLSPGGYAVIEIADDGGGVPESIQDLIFEPFFTTKDEGKGTGLGLASVVNTMRIHGGGVELDPHKGSFGGGVFRLYFPLALANKNPSTLPAEVSAGGTKRTNVGKILVVDDEQSVRTMCADALRSVGYDVEVAADGIECLDIIRTDPEMWSLVLIDATMPRLDGPSTVDQLRELYPSLPIVLMSGVVTSQDLAARLPADVRMLRKPFRLRQLHMIIGDTLDRAGRSSS